MRRPLTLRKEPLSDLTPGDLAAVNGASVYFTIDGYPTWVCTPLVTAVHRATMQATHEMTVVDCA